MGQDHSILFLGAANTLYYPNAAMTINAFRAYFQLSDGTLAREFRLNFGDGEASSIDNGKLKIENEAGAWYTLDGRKLQGKPTKSGLYIHGNRKVVIK